MEAKDLSKYEEILLGGFAGSDSACFEFLDLADDVVAVMVKHPQADDSEACRTVILNSKLRDSELYQFKFTQRMGELNTSIIEEMGAAGLDAVSLALAYFCVSVDNGLIDPYEAPLTKAVTFSGMEGWSADMTACHVYARYIDAAKFAKCGSQQLEASQN